MTDGPRAYWLETSGGTRLAIKPAGLLIGRAAHCDVVLTDVAASRVQAIVFAGSRGACLTVLGKGATAVNGAAVTHERDLIGGDRVEVPGLALAVVAGAAPAASPGSSWVVRGPGGLFGVVRTPFDLGGAADADLRVAGVADRVLRLHVAERLHVEALTAIEIDGVGFGPGEIDAVGPGAVITCQAGRFEVVAGGALGQDSTAAERTDDGPGAVRLEFLSRGGRLTVTWRGRERAVYLPERRCDLVAALLQPPAPFAAGDHVPDDTLLPRVWPGKVMTRVDLNVLLHRARQDLVRAELDGAGLLERAAGGNATRFRLARDATVVIE